ncbi:uncharacterized protein PRCAT00005858001 [Priceomyces carsonii]|uniref:uncharacterized protein n=1 Tax=Priceomyces carsonii TaxID=28549 RepID=UPI002ED7A54D|nr:unnamed protein product [Priceomyces carsonii]
MKRYLALAVTKATRNGQPLKQGSQFVAHSVSAFSTGRSNAVEHKQVWNNSDVHLGTEEKSTHGSNEDEGLPWYLRDDIASSSIEKKVVELPPVPEGAPSTVAEFLNLLSNDYGLRDIQLFDLRKTDSDENRYASEDRLCDFVIICTGKSERHNYKAADEMKRYIKHEHNHLSKLEGLVSGVTSPVERRRMLRRARKGPLATDNDYGKAPNSWVMCDTEIDNIIVHILTKQRREELNLESLFTSQDETGDTKRDVSNLTSDNIFSGIRRHFHTKSAFHDEKSIASSASLKDLVKNLLNEQSAISTAILYSYLGKCDALFENPSLDDYNVKYELYKAMHLINPEVVSFEKAESAILEKYSSLPIALNSDVDFENERLNDVLKYMKLLIDSPELRAQFEENKYLYCDALCDKLSDFVSVLFRFSNQQLNLASHPEFIMLLWHLSYIEIGHKIIGSRDIDEVLYGNQPLESKDSSPSIAQAGNRARDIRDLINIYNEVADYFPTMSLKELQLFTYGNAGNWPKFWREWEISFNLIPSQVSNSGTLVRNWVRIAIYLAMRNDKTALLYFLNNYWSNSTSIARSFIRDFKTNNETFNSKKEQKSFQEAITRILKLVSRDEHPGFPHVRAFIEELN